MDPRITKLAKLLVNYSLEVKKGQLVKIQGQAVSLPLMTAAYEEVVRVGGNPYIVLQVEEADEAMLKHGTDAQLSYVSPLAKLEVEKIDALLHVWGSSNTRFLSQIDPKRQAMRQKARRETSNRFFERVAKKQCSWVGTQFPTHADAQEAEMSLADYQDFVYGAGHIDAGDPVKHWLGIKKEQLRQAKILNRISKLHIRSKETDLKMSVKGRKWISCHGTENFPDGEIFTSPIEDTPEGVIHFSYPAVYGGREVEDVRLELKGGKVIKESAGKNQKYLTEMLNMDEGSRHVGEIAIGTNYEIKRFSKNILFDEKIGGTCHMAVGMSIPEAGGKNKSGLHWDMVCNLKKDAEILGDGKVIYKNGKFVI